MADQTETSPATTSDVTHTRTVGSALSISSRFWDEALLELVTDCVDLMCISGMCLSLANLP